MKSTIYFSLGAILLLALLVSFGAVMADPMVTQTPEIQGFTSTTSMNVVGLATENDAIAWQDSNNAVTTSNLKLPAGFWNVPPYVLYIPDSVLQSLLRCMGIAPGRSCIQLCMMKQQPLSTGL